MARLLMMAAVVAAAACGIEAAAQNVGHTVFGNERNDTTRLTEILVQSVGKGPARGAQEYVLEMALNFEGTPYRAGTLDAGDDHSAVVNLDGMDCTTFVETALALAMTAGEGRSSWRDYVYNLERLRYRGGKADGYASRLHYVSDWALDNQTRGIMREVTDRVGKTDYQVKSIDWMTRHRDDYPAMKDSATYAAIKHIESGYHGYRTGYIKAANVERANLRDGDIVAFTTKKEGLDAAHIGIVKMVKGKAHLVHASRTAGKTLTEERPLADYLRRNRDFTGIRVFRLQ